MLHIIKNKEEEEVVTRRELVVAVTLPRIGEKLQWNEVAHQITDIIYDLDSSDVYIYVD